MKTNNIISIFAFFLIYLTACYPTRKERRVQMQLIQQSNKEAIDKGKTPYDSVHVKKDTLFYYRNNESQMKTIIIKN